MNPSGYIAYNQRVTHQDIYDWVSRCYSYMKRSLPEIPATDFYRLKLEYLIDLTLPLLEHELVGFPAIAKWLLRVSVNVEPITRDKIAETAMRLFTHTERYFMDSTLNQAWAVKLMQLSLNDERRVFLEELYQASESALVQYVIAQTSA